MFRVGIGYDVHRLVSGRKLIVGGVEIPCKLGLEGHSDADVLIHAIMDALLGAAGEKDIGYHFPDTDQNYKNISSLILLRRVYDLIKSKGYVLNNLDSIIVAQKPRFSPFIEKMKENISSILEVDPQFISIKATTTEYMGFIGREEGISAYSLLSLKEV